LVIQAHTSCDKPQPAPHKNSPLNASQERNNITQTPLTHPSHSPPKIRTIPAANNPYKHPAEPHSDARHNIQTLSGNAQRNKRRRRTKSNKLRSPNISSHTTLIAQLIAARALENATPETQHPKFRHKRTQTHKPHHTTINASRHNDASMRLHHISKDCRLISIDRFNPVTLTTTAPPLAPRIVCSKHATCAILMTIAHYRKHLLEVTL
jgi:hypothetical protein